MKITKKPELLTLKKAIVPKPEHEQIDTVTQLEPIIAPQPAQDTQTPVSEYLPNYPPVPDYPILPSAGNSGWQASDIWRDIRVDSFCD